MNINREIIKGAKIVVATHEYATGFAQHLEHFLKEKENKKLLYIHHPLHPDYDNSNGSGYRIYDYGQLNKVVEHDNTHLPSSLLFLNNFLQNLFWVTMQKEKWDLYIGSNNLNALAGVILRKIGFVKKCIFYTVDFVPKRFENRIINSIYLWIDKFCVKHCNETWILSPRMKEGRKKYFNLDEKFSKKQIYVPEGIWLKRIRRQPFGHISNHSIVFLGVLLERMGIQLILKAVPLVTQIIPDFRLIIIGKGKYGPQLEKLMKKLHIEKHVEFKGYINDYRDVEKIVAKCAIGVSTYTNDPTGLNYYADPAKTKTYLGCGLPIIATNTFHNALEIEKRGAGIVVNENPGHIANAIISLLNNENKLKKYKENAVKLAQEFDNDVIFTKNLLRILRD